MLSSGIEIQGDGRIPAFPFRLSTKTESAPSYFEVIFLDKDTRFRYGFKADTAKIHAEWLFRRKPGAKEVRLFTREGLRKIQLRLIFRKGLV